MKLIYSDLNAAVLINSRAPVSQGCGLIKQLCLYNDETARLSPDPDKWIISNDSAEEYVCGMPDMLK